MAGELVFVTGATGFVGFAVLLELLKSGYKTRVSVRKEAQIKTLQEHALIAPYASSVEFVVVPDITVEGAFDNVLEGVTYIQHIASPLANETEKLHENIVLPAINGTTSILGSALKFPSITRIVITSSVAAVTTATDFSAGSKKVLYTHTRVDPLPAQPWANNYHAYISSKVLALDATEKFVAEKKPQFSIVNVLPAFVLGRHELAKAPGDLLTTTNQFPLSIVLGQKFPVPFPGSTSNLKDVVRVHVGSLDETKVPKGESRNFLITSGPTVFNDAIEIAKKHFPEAVASGALPLGGSITPLDHILDTEEAEKVWGKSLTYEDSVKDTVGQYLELSAKAAAAAL